LRDRVSTAVEDLNIPVCNGQFQGYLFPMCQRNVTIVFKGRVDIVKSYALSSVVTARKTWFLICTRDE